MKSANFKYRAVIGVHTSEGWKQMDTLTNPPAVLRCEVCRKPVPRSRVATHASSKNHRRLADFDLLVGAQALGNAEGGTPGDAGRLGTVSSTSLDTDEELAKLACAPRRHNEVVSDSLRAGTDTAAGTPDGGIAVVESMSDVVQRDR